MFFSDVGNVLFTFWYSQVFHSGDRLVFTIITSLGDDGLRPLFVVRFFPPKNQFREDNWETIISLVLLQENRELLFHMNLFILFYLNIIILLYIINILLPVGRLWVWKNSFIICTHLHPADKRKLNYHNSQYEQALILKYWIHSWNPERKAFSMTTSI